MSNMGSYEEQIKDFNWSLSKDDLGYKDGDIINFKFNESVF